MDSVGWGLLQRFGVWRSGTRCCVDMRKGGALLLTRALSES